MFAKERREVTQYGRALRFFTFIVLPDDRQAVRWPEFPGNVPEPSHPQVLYGSKRKKVESLYRKLIVLLSVMVEHPLMKLFVSSLCIVSYRLRRINELCTHTRE